MSIFERIEANADEAKRILEAMRRRPFRKDRGDQIRRQVVVVPGVGVIRCSVVIRGNNDVEFWLKEYNENDFVPVDPEIEKAIFDENPDLNRAKIAHLDSRRNDGIWQSCTPTDQAVCWLEKNGHTR